MNLVFLSLHLYSQVCMAGEKCIGKGNERGGRCEPSFKFEKGQNPEFEDVEYSENFNGLCHGCAGGELKECGNAAGRCRLTSG